VKSLIVEDPQKRLSAEEALAHPWLNSTQSQNELHLDDDVLKSLRAFSRASHFRRACLSMMAWSLSCEDRQDLHQQFLSLDNANKGTITLYEFKEVFHDNYHIDSMEAQHIFEGLDLDGDQEISYSEFLAAAMHDHVRMHNDVLLKTFRRFDTSGSGSITVDNLREVLGDSFEGADVKDMLSEADFDNDGKVMYEEFLQYLQQHELEDDDEDDEDDEAEPTDYVPQPNVRSSMTQSLADQAFAALREGHGQSSPEASPQTRSPFDRRKHKWLEVMDKALAKLNSADSPDRSTKHAPLRRRHTFKVKATDDDECEPGLEDEVDMGRSKTCPG